MLISRNLTRVYVPIICFLGLLFSPLSIAAQKSELSSEFHKKQRQQLREKLPNNSVAVYFSAPVRNRANDVDFEYHPDPNFYYLTGWNEPHAVLIVYSSPQKDSEGTYFEKLYVRERDANNEMWNGRQLGVEGARKMGLDRVASKKDFSTEQNDFSRFDSVLMFDFKNDVRDNKNDSSDLFDLQKHFKNVIAIDPFMNDYDPNDITCNYMELTDVHKVFNNTILPFDNIQHIHKTSDDAIDDLIEQKFDFIYIDGAHNGEDILSDAIESYKLLNINGILFFDDIVNANKNISIQSYTGFEKFIEIYKKNLKILYLKNIGIVKKIK